MKLLEELICLLNENRKEYIKNLWGDKIVKRRDRSENFQDAFDDEMFRLADAGQLYDEEKQRPQMIQQSDEITVDVALNILSQAGEKHLQWITKQWLAGQFKLEDIIQLKSDISSFNQLKPRLPTQYRDLNKLPDLNSLYDLIEKFGGVDMKSDNTEDKKLTKKLFKTKQAESIYHKFNIRAIVLNTEKASCHFGIGTKWCTANASSENMFDEYHDRGNIYIIYAGGHRYQLGIGSRFNDDDADDFQSWEDDDDGDDDDDENYEDYIELMNEKNQPVDPDQLAQKFPPIGDAFNAIFHHSTNNDPYEEDYELWSDYEDYIR